MSKKENVKENNDIQFKKINNFWKIRRGSNYNAFHRKNLGSIPSKFDNFIFKLPDESKTNLTSTLKPIMFKDENLCFRKDIFKQEHKSLINFGSGNSIELKGNSLKFAVNNSLKSMKKSKSEYDSTNLESFKTLYSNTNDSTAQTYKENKEIKYKEKDNNESKNKYESDKTDISLNLSLYKDRIKKSKSLINKFNRESRYDNIYYRKEILGKYYPGPGDYENDEYNIINPKNPLRYGSLFKYKSSFPLIELKNTMYNLGPGSYNLKEKEINGGKFSKLKKSDNLINNKEKNNNIGPGYIDLPGGIHVKDKDKMNHYFLIVPKKEENLEKKYDIERNEKIQRKDINKFGEFNVIPRWSAKEKTKNFNNDWINKSLERKIKEEKLKGNVVEMNEDNMYSQDDENIKPDIYFWAKVVNDELKIGKEKAKKKKGAYTFSKIPKLVQELNHVPGPGYYKPNKLLKKKEFNSNLDMNWI